MAVVLFFLALGCPGDGSNLVDGILDPAPFILDDFEDGTVMGWTQGNNSPDPPTNIPDGGPDGIGDNYLETRSMGIVVIAIIFSAKPPPHDRAGTQRRVLETATQPGGERFEIERRRPARRHWPCRRATPVP